MRLFLSALTLLLASTFPLAAHADPIYPILGSAGGFSGSGTLTASSNGDGTYTIVGITGTGVTGLIAAGGFNSNDNLLFPGTSNFFDTNGFSFTDSMGDTDFEINIASNGAGSYFLYLFDSDGYSVTLPIDLTVNSAAPSPSVSGKRFAFFNHQNAAPTTQDFTFSFDTLPQTPEPSSLIFLGTGLVAVAGAARRRFKRDC
jgi:hypothetical protein